MIGLRKLKIKRNVKDLNFNYDHDHDVLYISIGKPTPSYSDEAKLKGVLIRREIDTEKVTGVTILDYSKRNKKILSKYIPFKVDFEGINI